MSFLKKEELLGGLPLRTQRVEIPEFGEGRYVVIREMTGAQRDDYEASLWEDVPGGGKVLNLENATAKLIVRSVTDDDGYPVLDESDVIALGKKMGAGILRRMADVAKELSGITDAKIEKLAKNSKTPQAD
jgi:hypothetical protein